MDKFKIGDMVRFKTFDELFETYHSKNRIQRSIRVQSPFYDCGVGFYSAMYSLLGMPFEILDVFPSGNIKGHSPRLPGLIWRVKPEWLATDGDNIDFIIDEEKVFQII